MPLVVKYETIGIVYFSQQNEQLYIENVFEEQQTIFFLSPMSQVGPAH
jgi:hypothetical protein